MAFSLYDLDGFIPIAIRDDNASFNLGFANVIRKVAIVKFFKFVLRQEIIYYFEFHKATSYYPALSMVHNTNIKYILRIYILSIHPLSDA